MSNSKVSEAIKRSQAIEARLTTRLKESSLRAETSASELEAYRQTPRSFTTTELVWQSYIFRGQTLYRQIRVKKRHQKEVGPWFENARTRRLERRIAKQRKRAAKAAAALDKKRAKDEWRIHMRDLVVRAKAAIGSVTTRSGNWPFDRPTSNPTETSYNGSVLGFGAANREYGAQHSNYQHIRALRAKKASIPWLPYSFSTVTEKLPVGTISYTDGTSLTGILTYGGVAAAGQAFASYPAPWDSLESGPARTDLLTMINDRVLQSSFDVPSTLAELEENALILRQASQSAQKWSHSLGTMFRSLEPLLPAAVLGLIAADAWLAYKLAIRPAVKSFEDAASVLRQRNDPLYVVDVTTKAAGPARGTAHSGIAGVLEPWTYFELKARTSTRVFYKYRVDNPLQHAANILHLNEPLSGIWEGIPFSFLLDYFIKVGQWLRAAEARGSRLTAGSFEEIWYVKSRLTEISVSGRSTSSGAASGSGSGRYHDYSRFKGDTIPYPGSVRMGIPKFTTESGRGQWLIIAALLAALPFRRFLTAAPATNIPFLSPYALARHWINSKDVVRRTQASERKAILRKIADQSRDFHFKVDVPLP